VVKENLSVNIDNGLLSLSGVRKLQTKKTVTWEEFGNVHYVRSFSVPPSIDVGRVEAELKDGVLRLHMAKSEQAKPKRIEIKTA
jgi:HSP20 family molecular chaperone IbpA